MPIPKSPFFQKGHPGYKPKGAKSKTTLLKEERRAIFDAEVSKVFLDKIKEARPEYLLDQFLGKSPDKVEHSGGIMTGSLSAEAIAIAEEELKKRKLNDSQ